MVSIESNGKNVREAIELGLKKLDKSLGEVEVKIISQGGLLRKAKVLITVLNEETVDFNIEDLGKLRTRPEKDDKHYKDLYKAHSTSCDKNDHDDEAQFNKAQSKPTKDKKPFNQQKSNKQNVNNSVNNSVNNANNNANSNANNNVKSGKNANSNANNSVNQANQAKNNLDKPFTRGNSTSSNVNASNNLNQSNQNAKSASRAFGKKEYDNNRDKNRDNEKKPKRTDEDYAIITDEIKQRAENFLQALLQKMGADNTIVSTVNEKHLLINIETETGTVIGYRGETLSALEYLTTLSLNRNNNFYRVSVDCNGYKEKREQSLIVLAQRMATKAIKTGRKVILEPMSSVSRKVIHSVLAENEHILTKSEGSEPNRRIVIIPKRPQKPKQN